jgi:2-polyprenyl-6-hydroxyphenyl methylase/3-demethylubiquinone-9 3-methyltransferase
VDRDGLFFLSIYNDQGYKSRFWRRVKRIYNRLPSSRRPLLTALVMGPRELAALAIAVARGNPAGYVRKWTEYKRRRGMSRWHDIVDWMGGYPFEVATPDEVFAFLKERGFRLERLVTHGGGSACNEYVFSRPGDGPDLLTPRPWAT